MDLDDGNLEASTWEVNGEYISINVEEDMECTEDETEGIRLKQRKKTGVSKTDQIEQLMKEMDLDGDQKITEEEFIKGVSKWLAKEEMDRQTIVKEQIEMMMEKFAEYKDMDPNPIKLCIYKVPKKLHMLDKDSYNPRVVSIGPIHHGKPDLHAMEPYKWRCLKRYLDRSLLDVESVAQIATAAEGRARAYYKDSFDSISRTEFSLMMMLDCVFLIEHMLENVMGARWLSKTTCDAAIFGSQLLEDILHDMLLLENQIPYVLLYEFFVEGIPPLEDNSSTISLPELISTFFKDVGIPNTNFKSSEDIKNISSRHLLDFLRETNSLTLRRPEDQKYQEMHRGPRKGTCARNLQVICTATELEEAGVKFKKKETVDCLEEKLVLAKILMKEDKRNCLNCNKTSNCLCDIQFTNRGVLTMPPLKVNEFFETFSRNLIAFEQCTRYDDEGMHITSYIILMGNLIKTPKDVDLLVDCGIIEDLVEDSKVVSSLFSNLCKEITMDKKDFDFAPLCEDLNMYRRDYWHQMKASWLRSKQVLIRDYFGNMWTTISVFAASILLILTVIQTICSILQV